MFQDWDTFQVVSVDMMAPQSTSMHEIIVVPFLDQTAVEVPRVSLLEKLKKKIEKNRKKN